jgi:3-phenylpropionate/trans-cinnamate dioxygenase ferredoxin subunit
MEQANIEFLPVAEAVELPSGERLSFEVDGKPVVVFNIAGGFYAIGDICTHDNGPLGEGELDGFKVKCPRHGARFDVRDGKALTLPAVKSTPSYPVRVVDGWIEIGLPHD